MTTLELTSIGHVESPLTDLASAPRQADERAPEAWLVFEPQYADGLRGLRSGQPMILLTWLHHARRDVLIVHPSGDTSRPKEGVFTTRSPQRPNPIGLHDVRVTRIDNHRVLVQGPEALDGTPILDFKPVLDAHVAQR